MFWCTSIINNVSNRRRRALGCVCTRYRLSREGDLEICWFGACLSLRNTVLSYSSPCFQHCFSFFFMCLRLPVGPFLLSIQPVLPSSLFPFSSGKRASHTVPLGRQVSWHKSAALQAMYISPFVWDFIDFIRVWESTRVYNTMFWLYLIISSHAHINKCFSDGNGVMVVQDKDSLSPSSITHQYWWGGLSSVWPSILDLKFCRPICGGEGRMSEVLGCKSTMKKHWMVQ